MTWALVGNTAIGGGTGSATTIVSSTTPLSPAATNGNLLVGFVCYDVAGVAISNITDNGTGTANSWQIAFDLTQTDNDQRFAMIYCVNQRTSGTLTQVTATVTSCTYRSIYIREYSGNHATPFDGSQNSAVDFSYTAGTDVILSGTVAPSVAGDLIVGGTFSSAPTATVTAGTGFGNFLVDITGALVAMEDRVEAGTTASQALFSDSASGNALCGVMAFKPLAGAAVTPTMWNFT